MLGPHHGRKAVGCCSAPTGSESDYLVNHGVMVIAVSALRRSPRSQAHQAGPQVGVISGCDFNFDYNVSFTETTRPGARSSTISRSSLM
jgi:hypothetical protein